LEYSSTTAPCASMPAFRDEWALVHSDLNLARTTRANLLLVGTEGLVLNLVSVLVPDLSPGLTSRRRNRRLLLPPASSRVAAVVIRDVDALTPEDQLGLFNWLDAAKNGTQVVSTASAPLLPLVETGAFNAALYYRLNTVYINLSE
jgi:hypothetical protein